MYFPSTIWKESGLCIKLYSPINTTVLSIKPHSALNLNVDGDFGLGWSPCFFISFQ